MIRISERPPYRSVIAALALLSLCLACCSCTTTGAKGDALKPANEQTVVLAPNLARVVLRHPDGSTYVAYFGHRKPLPVTVRELEARTSTKLLAETDVPATLPSDKTCALVYNTWVHLVGSNPCARTTRVEAVGAHTSIIVEESLADGCDRIYLLWEGSPTSDPKDYVEVSNLAADIPIATLRRTADTKAGETYLKVNHSFTGPVFEGVYSVDAPAPFNRRAWVDAIAPH